MLCKAVQECLVQASDPPDLVSGHQWCQTDSKMLQEKHQVCQQMVRLKPETCVLSHWIQRGHDDRCRTAKPAVSLQTGQLPSFKPCDCFEQVLLHSGADSRDFPTQQQHWQSCLVTWQLLSRLDGDPKKWILQKKYSFDEFWMIGLGYHHLGKTFMFGV